MTGEVHYGVMHIDTDIHVTAYRGRDEAERRLLDCEADGASCYLVRAEILWERVPDGE